MISYKEIRNGNIELVKQFINKDNVNEPSLNGWSFPPLMAACYYGKLEIVKYLVSIGANVDTMNSDGSTPITIALQHNHQEVKDYISFVKRFKKC